MTSPAADRIRRLPFEDPQSGFSTGAAGFLFPGFSQKIGY
jgi:hypothetical protein